MMKITSEKNERARDPKHVAAGFLGDLPAYSPNRFQFEAAIEILRQLLEQQGESLARAATKDRSTMNLREQLTALLNQHSAENTSNTPDYILASFLQSCLDSWDLHTRERDRWWGNRSVLGVGSGHPHVPTSEVSLLPSSDDEPARGIAQAIAAAEAIKVIP